jgi:glutathione-regulated potassium-efflux system protein KefB
MVVVWVVGRYLYPWLFRLAVASHMNETFTAVVFIAVLGSAWLASRAGLSMAMGAFVMGVSLSGTESRHSLGEEVLPFKNLLLGLFFVSIGLTIDLSVLDGHMGKILTHVLAIVSVKILVLYLVARAMKMQHTQAARVSFLLSQAGEFGFVILGALLASSVVTPIQFSIGIMVIALTTVMTPWLDAIGVAWSRRKTPVFG